MGTAKREELACCTGWEEKKREGVVKVEHVGRGMRLYLLNGEMQAVGEGELGEIYIAGEGIAESYAGQRRRRSRA